MISMAVIVYLQYAGTLSYNLSRVVIGPFLVSDSYVLKKRRQYFMYIEDYGKDHIPLTHAHAHIHYSNSKKKIKNDSFSPNEWRHTDYMIWVHDFTK